jgi:hypothetical protein
MLAGSYLREAPEQSEGSLNEAFYNPVFFVFSGSFNNFCLRPSQNGGCLGLYSPRLTTSGPHYARSHVRARDTVSLPRDFRDAPRVMVRALT